ncbi:MAG: nitroreductase family protein [Methanomassiliicoccales archaeon]|nr:nitroreductase family protein [Methanomassiliicoccales archaeon]
MEVSSAIQKRRSIRKYKAKEVPHDLLLEILEAARLAPSGANRQPWQLIVVTDLERRRGLVPICKDQRFIADAGAFIAVIDDPAQKWARVDAAIAMEHIALTAVDKGLGTCFIGAFDGEKLAAYLGVPKPYVVTVGMALGYPDETPEARSRKPMAELVHWERFGGGD